MAIRTDHPFQEDVKVALREFHDVDYQERFVDRVYKTGHFTLRGSDRRWRPWNDGYRWSAWPVGKYEGSLLHRPMILLWDAETEQEATEQRARRRRRHRLLTVQERVAALRSDAVVDAVLDALEAALSTAGKPKESS